MTPLLDAFHGSYAAVRPYLLAKAFLLLLAFDAWMLMIGHAGRYGAGGFNVAHFAWLDATQPLPTPGMYIGLLLLCGLLALTLALWTLHRVGVALLFVLYTYSWSMSMLDSYQHHYFVSLCLLCLVFFPRVQATEVHPLGATGSALSDKQRRRRRQELEAAQRREQAGWVYAAGVVGLLGAALLWGGPYPHLSIALAIAAIVLGSLLLPTSDSAGPRHTTGFGYPLLCASVAVLYGYTTLAKTDSNWLRGHTLRRISKVEELYGPLQAWAHDLGIAPEAFWSYLASGVLPLEAAVAAGYLLAIGRDRAPHWATHAICLVAFVLAIALHLGAEAMGLQIGWFSYYMLVFGAVVLLPQKAADRLGFVVTWPARTLHRLLSAWEREDAATEGAALGSTLALAGSVALALAFAGYRLDLPGALPACALGALCVLGGTGLGLRRQRLRDCRAGLLAALGATAMMWVAISASDVRWDFYRYLGGDLARRGETEAAIEVYLRGERYAPAGQSRMEKVRRLQSELEAR